MLIIKSYNIITANEKHFSSLPLFSFQTNRKNKPAEEAGLFFCCYITIYNV